MKTEFQNERDAFDKRIDEEWLERCNPVTEELYHYTDVTGLIGILNEKNIRLTHVNYLNDSGELQHDREIAKELLERKIDKHKVMVMT